MSQIVSIEILSLPAITTFTLRENIVFYGLVVQGIDEDNNIIIIDDPYLEYEELESTGTATVYVYPSKEEKDVYATFIYEVVSALNNLKASRCASTCTTNLGICSSSSGGTCSLSSSYSCSCSSTQTSSCCTSSSSCSSSSSYSCSCSSTQTTSCCTSSSDCSSSSSYSCSCSSLEESSCCSSSSDCSSSSAYACSCSSTQTCNCTASGLSTCATCPTSGSYTTKNINIEVVNTSGEKTQVENVSTLVFDGTTKTVGIEYFRSNNYGVNSSTAQMTSSSVDLVSGNSISIDYYVLSESSYDKLYIYIYKDSSLYKTYGAFSGYLSGWQNITLSITESGSYYIICSYVKDSSNSYGADYAYIRRPYYIKDSINYLFEFTNTGTYGFTTLLYQKI